MGLFDGFRLTQESSKRVIPTINTGMVGLNTPAHNLNHIVLADILGTDAWAPVTRAEAMQIPAVAKARHLICGTVARLPLKTFKDGEPLAEQPNWLSRTDTSLSPQHRLAWIVDDLMFYGASLLVVDRNSAGRVIEAARVDPTLWSIDPDSGEILINGQPVLASSVVLIPALFEGLLNVGSRTIRAARDMESIKAARLRSPNPTTQIKLSAEYEANPEELEQVVDDWVKARNSPTGTVAVIPYGIDIINDGGTDTDLFIEATNAVGVQIAQLLNIPATLLDASVAAGASLNYQNMAASRSWWIDTSLNYWLTPIEAELSRDYITPRGTYMQFDLSNLIETPMPSTGPVLED